jgi:hypothetical protein
MTDEAKPAPKIVGGAPRLRSVPLAYPVEYDGVTHSEIVLARLTAAEVAAFQDAAAKLPDGASPEWPIYRDADGKPLPDAVLAALDDDDKFELDKALRDFLPRRFQAALANALARSTGASTASP